MHYINKRYLRNHIYFAVRTLYHLSCLLYYLIGSANRAELNIDPGVAMTSSSVRRSTSLLLAVTLAILGVVTLQGTASAVVSPEAWAGSPVTGKWNADARTHHWLGNAKDQGDWASDITAPAGTSVVVYVAPQKSGYTIMTRVDQIGAGCVAPRNGASFVTVGIYANGSRIGSITYGHVNPTVHVGQSVNRWGSVIGHVAGGLPVNSACWTGPHVHLQMFNVHNYSCFNRGYKIGSTLRPTNFVGFAGGHRVSGPRQACP